MADLPKCPVCGRKAFLSHDIVDGFDFGYSVGCPIFCGDDGVHGWSFDDPSEKKFAAHCFYTKQQAIDWWIRRVDKEGESE